MNLYTAARFSSFVSLAVFIAVGLCVSPVFSHTVSAAPYFYFDAESGTAGESLTNPPFCQTDCGESYQTGTVESAGGAPQGTNYFQWHIANLQHSVYNIVHNPSTFPFNPPLGSTMYLAYYFNYSRVNGVDVWHEVDDSADKGIELTGSGIRWITSPGHWGSLANNQDHHYTIWMGNPTYHLNPQFEGNPYWTVVPPNQSGYSIAAPPQLEYERWYSAVMAVKLATDNTGSVTLYLDGVKILEWNNIITAANTAPTIEHITMGGTIAQPAYDTPEHYRKYDALMLTDNWQDIVNGGYLGTSSIADTQAPTVPSGLIAIAASSAQIDLSWTTSTDTIGVTGYTIYRDGTQIATSPTNSYANTGLSASTLYTYTVSAYDAAGNNSARSAIVSATTQAVPVVATPFGTPVLNFSDLTSGPKTGWEGSTTQGSAVSIWGSGFGSSRGSSYVTVNGAQLTAASDYAEWGVTTNNARGLERITFWLNNFSIDGPGGITVTVNGETSNTLPFTVRAGNIYFIDGTNGSDSFNGEKAVSGASGGPWKHFYMASPTYNSAFHAGDIVYVRGGIYNEIHPNSGSDPLIMFNNVQGTSDSPYMIAAFPGEFPQLGDQGHTKGIYNRQQDGGGIPSHGITFSKFLWSPGCEAINIWGNYWRIVGNTLKDNICASQSAALSSTNSAYTEVLGNVFDHNGNPESQLQHHLYFTSVCLDYGYQNCAESHHNTLAWNETMNGPGSAGNGSESWAIKTWIAGTALTSHDFYIHDNYWHDEPGEAIWLYAKVKDIYIYNNIFEKVNFYNKKGGIRSQALAGNAPAANGNLYLYNNTFYDWSNGVDQGAIVAFGVNDHWITKNNIFYSSNPAGWVLSATNGGSVISDHDLFYNHGQIKYSGGNVTTTNAIVSVNPQFRNSATHDFYLNTSSPAKDVGVMIDIFNKDYDGISRPQGSAYDIGAYEYYEGSVSAPAPIVTPPASTPITTPTTPPTSSSGSSFTTPSGNSSSQTTPSPAASNSSPATPSGMSTSPATHPLTQSTASPSITEGSLIRGPDGIKVYIINAHGYKRHIFNPAIFNMYGHFKWNEIKSVDQQTLDAFKTSDLYRADGDTKVFSLSEINEAQGLAQKRWFNTSATKFQQLGYTFNQVFIINPRERDYYQEGAPITN
ncbi:hypothetical protein HY839_03645 [Candidatus Azambacteria bacterium]|nr:hypothetical protein [Candidatus Azambacteria bacterium]